MGAKGSEIVGSKILDKIIDNYPEGIFVIDKKMHIQLFNKVCEKILCQDREKVIKGKVTCDVVFKCCTEDGKKYPKKFCPGLSVFKGRKPVALKEMVFKTAENKMKYALLSYYPIYLNNDVKYVVGIIKDISEKKSMESELMLSKKLASLGEIVTEIVHDIKNLLGIIVSASEIITNETRPQPQKRKAAELIKDEVRRLDKRIRSFLMFAKPKPLFRENTDINILIEKVVASYYTTASESFKISSNLAPNLPSLFVDSDQLQQVFLDLIVNAENATNKSGELVISTFQKAGFFYISFQDNGEGIDRENFDKIFEPFFSTKSDGTGLGLAIVKNILDAHKGFISVESEKNKGSTFTIKLPLDSA